MHGVLYAMKSAWFLLIILWTGVQYQSLRGMHVWTLLLVEASCLVFLVNVVVVVVVVDVFVYLLSLLNSSLFAVLPTDPPTTTTQPPSTQPPPTPKKDVDSPNTVVVDIGNSGRSLAAQWRHAVNQRFCQFIPHFFTFLFYFFVLSVFGVAFL